MYKFKNMDFVIAKWNDKEYLAKICGLTTVDFDSYDKLYIVEWYDKPEGFKWSCSNIVEDSIRKATKEEITSHLLSIVEEAKNKESNKNV